MKSKSLILMLLALAALVAAIMLTRSGSRPAAKPVSTLSAPPLLSFDINLINTVIIDTPSITQTLSLVRFDGRWAVANRSNFPADEDLVARNLRMLGDLKLGPEIRGGMDHLDEFGLTPASTTTLGAGYAEISFYAKGGKELGVLQIGSPRLQGGAPGSFTPPSGQYVRMKDGPVILVDGTPGDLPRLARDWLERDVLDVSSSDIVHVVRTLPDGSSFEVRQTAAGEFEIPGLAEGETLKTEGARLLVNCLQDLTLNDVMSLTNDVSQLGFEQAEQYQALLANGLLYTVALGTLAPVTASRHAKITVDFVPPEIPPAVVTTNAAGEVIDPAANAAKRLEETRLVAEKEDERLSKWVFLLPAGPAMNFALPRDQLIGPKENETAPESAPVATAAP